jgi:hypothetical protein
MKLLHPKMSLFFHDFPFSPLPLLFPPLTLVNTTYCVTSTKRLFPLKKGAVLRPGNIHARERRMRLKGNTTVGREWENSKASSPPRMGHLSVVSLLHSELRNLTADSHLNSLFINTLHGSNRKRLFQ